MFRPIYEPRTRAKEYADLALNIYTGCNHGCIYCYAPSDIDWGEFGRECERLCKQYGRNYYIKEDLRALM